jgi:hypothetical protein
VPGVTGVSEVAIGYEFSCARMQSGEASCWGANPGGALGNGGSAIEVSPTPVMLDDVERFGAFTLGHYSSCAIHDGGTLSCWGDASRGQLGIGVVDMEDHPLPLEVSIGEAEHLALGYFHVCVALSAGGVSCFGSNGWGELGNDDLGSEPEPSPVTAMGIEDTRQLAAGQQFTCAILEGPRRRLLGRQPQRPARRRNHDLQHHPEDHRGVRGRRADRGGPKAHLRGHARRRALLLGSQRRGTARRRDHHGAPRAHARSRA